MVVHFILDMLIYVLLCVVYSFCPLEKFVRVASKTRDLMLWCAAVTAEKDECAGIANMELGMREIDNLICDLYIYTYVGSHYIHQILKTLNTSLLLTFLNGYLSPFCSAIKYLELRDIKCMYNVHVLSDL